MRGLSRQEEVNCYTLGIRGCAAHCEAPPPLLPEHQGPDAHAWRCYGEIIFWLYRPGLAASQLATNCRPLWNQLATSHLHAAVDPLRMLHFAAYCRADLTGTVLECLLKQFPDEIRLILRHGLTSPDAVTSLFPYGNVWQSACIVDLLSIVGDKRTITDLAALLDHPSLGPAAVRAVRAIRTRLNRFT